MAGGMRFRKVETNGALRLAAARRSGRFNSMTCAGNSTESAPTLIDDMHAVQHILCRAGHYSFRQMETIFNILIYRHKFHIAPRHFCL